MRSAYLLFAVALMSLPSRALGQQPIKETTKETRITPELEAVLWDVDQQWLCDGVYQKPYADCVKFRSTYWVDGFFEVQSAGTLRNKTEMVATQSAASPLTGVRPYPADFRLVAVYGNVAIGTDHTDFKTVDANGKLAFTADSHCLRVFVKQDGTWRPAAAALVPVIPPTEASAKMSGAAGTKSPDEKIEKELAEIDQKWIDAARDKNLDYLKQLFTDRWLEIIGWNPTVVLNKAAAIDMMANANYKPGEGVSSDQFKLMALYGDVALATARRIRKSTDANGNAVVTPYRGLLIFLKENGQWKSAGGALVPISAK